MLKGIKKYFGIKELVCPHVYKRFGESAWTFFDPRLLEVLLFIRETLGKRIYINNWARGGSLSQRGLRCNCCELVKSKTLAGTVYMSAHNFAMAVDFNVEGMSVSEVHAWIEQNKYLLPHPIRLEEPDGVNRVHLDVRSDGSKPITWFKA